MDFVTIAVALATVIGGVLAAIQLWEWWRKKKRLRKRKITLDASGLTAEKFTSPLKIINFTHPLTSEIIKQVKTLVGQPISEIIEIKTQLDEDESFDSQIDQLVDKVGLTSKEWQEGKFLVHLPGFSQAAATVIAELHGRMGHFPTILRIRGIEGTSTRQYELAEIINLQNTRDTARNTR